MQVKRADADASGTSNAVRCFLDRFIIALGENNYA
jgi:hypothetical protein